MGSVKTLADLVELDEPLVLYAVFSGQGNSADPVSPDESEKQADPSDTPDEVVIRPESGRRGTALGSTGAGARAEATVLSSRQQVAKGAAAETVAPAVSAALVDDHRVQAADPVSEPPAVGDTPAASADIANAVGVFAALGAGAAALVAAVIRALRNRRLDSRSDDFDEASPDQERKVDF